MHESLDLARTQLRDEQRRAALAKHVETLIRSRHQDPVLAAIAATTLDIDAVAAELTNRGDVAGWARVIGANLLAPQPSADTTEANTAGSGEPAAGAAATPITAPMPRTDVLRRVPTNQDAYDRWRQLWAELAADPDIDAREFADRHGISLRQVQWIRSSGNAHFLDSPTPPAVLLAQQLASANGHLPHKPTPAS
jgi:hypothetical protein